jgi:hypothetical protein
MELVAHKGVFLKDSVVVSSSGVFSSQERCVGTGIVYLYAHVAVISAGGPDAIRLVT